MDRRRFLRFGAGVAAVGTLQAYAAPIGFSANAKSKPKDMTAAEFHDALRFVKTEQGRIAYFDLGTGPVAVFLHGFPLNSFQWRGVIPRLAEYRRCIAPDFLALGYTEEAKAQSVTPTAQVHMLAAFLHELSIGGST